MCLNINTYIYKWIYTNKCIYFKVLIVVFSVIAKKKKKEFSKIFNGRRKVK